MVIEGFGMYTKINVYIHKPKSLAQGELYRRHGNNLKKDLSHWTLKEDSSRLTLIFFTKY